MKKLLTIIVSIMMLFACVGCNVPFFGTSDAEFSHKANTVAIKASVKIQATHTSYFYDTVQSVGSGVIYKYDDSCYYILTNYHVVEKPSGYDKTSFVIFDCYGNQYVINRVYASSVEDDLALLVIPKKAGVELMALPFANQSVKTGDTVGAITCPGGIINVVTIGEVTGYEAIDNPDSGITVTYPVITHTAYIDNGSSGGMLINKKLEIVGVNFAGGVDEDENFVEGYAIPLENVLNFVN